MKTVIGCVAVSLVLMSCSTDIEGTWHYDDGYHRATYELTKGLFGIDAKVVKYEDGTTLIAQSAGRYLFTGANQVDDVDAVSGASKMESISLQLLDENHLKVRTIANGMENLEIWERTHIQ